nr:fibronectin type III domain-containing protein [Elusimicrobiota bacterium]
TINWTWANVASETGYRIKYATDTTTLVKELDKDITVWPETGLTINTSYFRVIVATNSVGESGLSDAATTWTLSNPPVTFAFNSVTKSTAGITWAPNNNPNYTRYGLAKSTDSSFSVAVDTFVTLSDNLTDTTTVAYNLNSGATYYFRVWAYNGEGIMSDYIQKSTRTWAVDIRINEVSYLGSSDWVEIYCIDDGNSGNGVDISSYVLTDEDVTPDPQVSTYTAVTITTGEYAVVYNSVYSTKTESSSSDDKNNNGIFDIYIDWGGFTATDDQAVLRNDADNIIDAACWANNDGTAGEMTDVDTVNSEGEWNIAGGAAVETDCVDSSTGTVIRRDENSTDTNDKSDWSVESSSTAGKINAHKSLIDVEQNLYTGTATRALITLEDSDLNNNPGIADTVVIKVTSTVDSTGIDFDLQETGINTGIFTSEAAGLNLGFTQGLSLNYDKIKVTDKELVTVSYNDSYYGIQKDTATWNIASVIFSEVYVEKDSGAKWAELYANRTSDISNLMITDLDGSNPAPEPKLGSASEFSPINVSSGDFIVVHFSSYTNNSSENGYLEIWLDYSGNNPYGTDDQLVIDDDNNYSNGGYLDSIVWCNGDSVEDNDSKGDVETYLESRGEWIFETSENYVESDAVELGNIGTSMARSSSTAVDNNNKYDWDIRSEPTPGEENGADGYVYLDKEDYHGTSSSATVKVSDINLNLDSGATEQVTVQVQSSSDTTDIDIILTESGPDTAVFISTYSANPDDFIRFKEVWTGGSNNGSNTLMVREGSTITVTYTDALDVSNTQATQEALATYHLTGVGGGYFENATYRSLGALARIWVVDSDLNTNTGVQD